MTKLRQVIDDCRSRLRKHRNVLTFLDSEDFERSLKIFTGEEVVRIEIAIEQLDLDALRNIVNSILAKLTPLERLSSKQLRDLARNHRVPNYYNLTKAELIKGIENEVHRLKEISSGICNQPRKT